MGDLLDFDDTRAPRILYSYVACNEKSRTEWDKHQASAGFRYPAAPSTDDLPYKARCTNPGVEHAIRDFLDWIDEELGNCVKLQKYCRTSWQQEFLFPRAVLRDEIESDGYMSGDFCLTMDQTQILKLLTGENLYDNTDVFIRELLQNAIDATLLRGEMDPNFIPEKSRIDLWEWNDKEGNIWFRIDDQGTGMTLGMLQRYFLKVGNSYYNSRELERDLRDHGQVKKYNGISRFGIGFLSSFLCGDYAEVSTLYFDSEKNRREETSVESYQTIHYGLRLQVTGLSGYYTLKNQSKHHQANGQLPVPDSFAANVQNNFEMEGYRAKPGTSIVIQLTPGKLGALNLCKATEKYLCGARVPVYYNNKRIGRTYEEIMQAAHEMEGEKIYELTPELRKRFDSSFPAVCGQYPKIAVSVISLDTEENQVLPEFSGMLVKYDVRFDKVLQWKVKDQTYKVDGYVDIKEENVEITLRSRNKSTVSMYGDEWEQLKKNYDLDKVAALEAEFEKRSACPKTEEIIEVWQPFSEQMDLYEAWRIYHDNKQEIAVRFPITECGCTDMALLSYGDPLRRITCAYQGVVAGNLMRYRSPGERSSAMFLLGSIWKPVVDISRAQVSSLPLKVLIAINGILNKYWMLDDGGIGWADLEGWKNSSLKEWREVLTSQLGKWMERNQDNCITKTKQMLQKALEESNINIGSFSMYAYSDYAIMNRYLMAYFQDHYRMIISYEDGQIISFYEKGDNEMEDIFDLFPPMMFCKAASDRSRRYICSEEILARRGITIDHPFVLWLLDNAVQLKQYYQRQFQQIVDCLCQRNVEFVIHECNSIREQLLALPEHHGVDVSAFPQLSMDDFWSM